MAGSRPPDLSQSSPPGNTPMRPTASALETSDIAHLDLPLPQVSLEFGNGDRAAVEHAGRQGTVHVGALEGLGEVLRGTGATGGYQRHPAQCTCLAHLLDVVATAHAVAGPAVEHDLAGAQALCPDDPVHRADAHRTGLARIAGVGAHPPLAIGLADGIDADHHALDAKGVGQLGHQQRTLQGRRVDRDLVGTGMQYPARGFHVADAAGHAERDVDQPRHPFDPGVVDRAAFRAGADVVEHQLVGALVAIAHCQLDDVAHVDVVAEAHALDHAAVAHVQAGNDAAAQHGTASSTASASASCRRPSSSALPSTAPAQPAWRAPATSAASRTPPEACTATPGASRARCAYRSRLGPDSMPSRAMSVHSRWRRPASTKRG